MCGLAGFFDRSAKLSQEEGQVLLREMGNRIQHRGPDDHGEFYEPNFGVGVSFRRLAILDLSPTGHQPMSSASGRYTMAYNGEIFNYKRLQGELAEQSLLPSLKGTSDTEIMLACFEAWGIQATVKKFIGFFAIALWDHQENCLYLIRDRVGVKPMYYGWFGTALIFGSELKALRAHPSFHAEIDRESLAQFLQFSYVPAPNSIYKGVSKLPSGTILKVSADGSSQGPTPYWSLDEASVSGARNRFSGSREDAVLELERLLKDCIGLRMIADVPLGAFLSGGVDSSLVVALMQAQSSIPVRTFSVGFQRGDYDEAEFAKEVAKHLGTNHTEHYVSDQDALDVVPLLPSMFDEPFGDPSQIPTYLVSKMAREHVTVSLSGDGGDELFGGYNRYSVAQKLWKLNQKYSARSRNVMIATLKSLPPSSWEKIYSLFRWAMPSRLKIKRVSERIDVLQSALAAKSQMDLYQRIMSHWDSPETTVLGAKKRNTIGFEERSFADELEFSDGMMLTDMKTYMQEDVLAKVDRASMAVSLEAREPLLDHRLIEFALSLPTEWRVTRSNSKQLLRDVLYRHVPKELIERPKQGFAAPVGEWINGPLKDWADQLLDESLLNTQGFLDPKPILKMLSEHRSGRRNWQFALWNVLMFQAWLEDNF
jgi:asparagine synthase (glutamine-hydrolysing)